MAIIDDLREENAALDAFVSSLDEEAWRKQTVFWNWSVWDQIMHLHFIDEFGVYALTDTDRFAERVKEFRAGQAAGQEQSDQARTRYAGMGRGEALEAWRGSYKKIVEILLASEPKRRIPWFGPDMGPASFASARQMECWAHGQDIYDLFKVHRRNTDRIKNIAEIGVRTYGWSFKNRGLEAPPPPAIDLTAPSGAAWSWNSDSTEGRISGPAEDFALIVTQRRHVDDTALVVKGEGARKFLEIAQCFAGAPADGPKAGERVVKFEREL